MVLNRRCRYPLWVKTVYDVTSLRWYRWPCLLFTLVQSSSWSIVGNAGKRPHCWSTYLFPSVEPIRIPSCGTPPKNLLLKHKVQKLLKTCLVDWKIATKAQQSGMPDSAVPVELASINSSPFQVKASKGALSSGQRKCVDWWPPRLSLVS